MNLSIDTLGSRIRKIREAKDITREELCYDETELSVRQLSRIEKGESVPSLAKLSFIAEKLDIKVDALLDPSNLYEYCQFKSKLELFAIDYDSEKNEEIDHSLSIIYDKYYDALPKEEQMYVDCSATSHEVRQTLNPAIATMTLHKYKHVLKSKKLYSSNELAYIALYAWVICLENKNIEINQNIRDIHMKLETEDQLSIELLIRTQINIASYFYYQDNYTDAIEILDYAQCVANEKKVFHRMPIIYMIKAKCLHAMKNNTDAKEQYQKAITLAKMLELNGLEAKVKKEFFEDFKEQSHEKIEA